MITDIVTTAFVCVISIWSGLATKGDCTLPERTESIEQVEIAEQEKKKETISVQHATEITETTGEIKP